MELQQLLDPTGLYTENSERQGTAYWSGDPCKLSPKRAGGNEGTVLG